MSRDNFYRLLPDETRRHAYVVGSVAPSVVGQLKLDMCVQAYGKTMHGRKIGSTVWNNLERMY